MTLKVATCIAPVNIAVVKYWGKRDEKLILPLNDSLSGTLSTDQMCAKTTVAISSEFTKDRIWLNGVEESITNPRLVACIMEIKQRAKKEATLSDEMLSWHIHICSENNFPTAAGLASSAAGYACLVYSLAQLFEIPGDISTIARQGSGSACRSVYGGFVAWETGSRPDGTDSIARQIVPESHWPEMRILILVVSDSRKKTSSTSGMQRSAMTSDLLKYRVSYSVPKNMSAITKAIVNRDFEKFAEVTMRESNQLHAVALDTYPPCVYMKDVSHGIVELVHKINECAKKTIVAYTFDAGPNACLYLLEENVPLVAFAVSKIFPHTDSVEFYKGMKLPETTVPEEFKPVLDLQPWPCDSLRYLIYTKIGSGPKVLSKSCESTNEHLLNLEGYPHVS